MQEVLLTQALGYALCALCAPALLTASQKCPCKQTFLLHGIIRYRKSGGTYAYLHIHTGRKIRLGGEAKADDTAREGCYRQGDFCKHLLERLRSRWSVKPKKNTTYGCVAVAYPMFDSKLVKRYNIITTKEEDELCLTST